MYNILIELKINFKKYINNLFYGDSDEEKIMLIYIENNINIDNIYKLLGKINKFLTKEKNYEKILDYINREIKYENELFNYEKRLDLDINTNIIIQKIELVTNLRSLKRSFEKIIYIRDNYYKYKI